LSLQRRIAVAVVIGAVAGLFSYVALVDRGYLASDFQWPLRAAQALLAGEDPYEVIVPDEVIVPEAPYPFHMHFYYPLPAALPALPLAGLDPYLAGALFFGFASAAMAFALASGPLWRMLMFVSPSFMVAAQVAQWSPLFVAAALLPALQAFAACKPNLGLASFLFQPTRRGAIAAAVFVLASLAIFPAWPRSWIETALMAPSGHPSPLLVLPGFVLVLSLLAWRSREGRLLAVMSVFPQSLFWYDQLMLFLIPRTARQMIAFTAASWVGYIGWHQLVSYMGIWEDMAQVVILAPTFVVATMHLPALALVLSYLWNERRVTTSSRQSAKSKPAGEPVPRR
jgi:hypothetical protein